MNNLEKTMKPTMKRRIARLLTGAVIGFAVYLWKVKGIEPVGNVLVFALWCKAILLIVWGLGSMAVKKPSETHSGSLREALAEPGSVGLFILQSLVMASLSHFWLAGALVCSMVMAQVGVKAQALAES